MLYGVHFMRETKSLVTTSVLYTIWEHEKKTFSDVLAEFVLYCLAHFDRGEIDINCLYFEITKEFGLDLPCAVCERILKRISKRNNHIVAKENNLIECRLDGLSSSDGEGGFVGGSHAHFRIEIINRKDKEFIINKMCCKAIHKEKNYT